MTLLQTAPADISVILLYNIDPEWTREEKDETIRMTHQLKEALQHIGHAVWALCVENENFEHLLCSYDPMQYIIFNWCEDIPGTRHGEWKVAEKLEHLGYTFTGAGSETLRLAQDKYRVKKFWMIPEFLRRPGKYLIRPTQETGIYFPRLSNPAMNTVRRVLLRMLL